MRHLITLTLLALSTGIAAKADIIYYYTGQDFTSGNTSSSVTGEFSLSSPLGDNLNEARFGPTSFTLTDGTFTMDSATTVFANWQISTSATGAITNWEIYLEGGPAGSGEYTYLIEVLNDPNFGIGDSGTGSTTLSGGPVYANSNFVAGSFSTTPPGTETVPEPSSVVLLVTGLGGMALVVARRRRRVRL